LRSVKKKKKRKREPGSHLKGGWVVPKQKSRDTREGGPGGSHNSSKMSGGWEFR